MILFFPVLDIDTFSDEIYSKKYGDLDCEFEKLIVVEDQSGCFHSQISLPTSSPAYLFITWGEWKRGLPK